MRIKSINFVAILILTFFIGISFLNDTLNGFLYYFIIPIMASLVLINIKKMALQIKELKKPLIFLFLLILYYSIIVILFGNIYFSDLKAVIFGMFFYLFLSSISLSKKQSDIVLYFFSVINIFCSTLIIALEYDLNYIAAVKNIGVYFYERKNAFSPLLSISIVLLFFKYNKNKLNYLIAFMGILNLIIIQSRTNILAIFVIFFISLLVYLIKNRSAIGIAISTILLSIILLITVINLESIVDFLKLSFRFDYLYTVNQSNFIDNLTTGRFLSLNYALIFFESNPLFSCSFDSYCIQSNPASPQGVHILLIRQLVYGGIIYFLLYITFIVTFIKSIIRNKGIFLLDKHYVYVLLIGVIVSFGEPFAPFGPITTYFIFWMVVAFDRDKQSSCEV